MDKTLGYIIIAKVMIRFVLNLANLAPRPVAFTLPESSLETQTLGPYHIPTVV